MKTIWKRLKLETPKFFKYLRNVSLTLTGMATAALSAVKLNDLTIPAIITTICTYVIVAGAVIASTSQLTVKEPEKLNQ